MSSRAYSDETLFDFELPTTREDIEALRRARQYTFMSFAEALLMLSRLELPSRLDLPQRTAHGWEPFSLE